MKKKILIVEDDRKIAMALGIRLKAASYAVLQAADALVATNLAVKHEPDLVLLDISIPGGNGFLVAERLQMMAPTNMIFITAHKEAGLREKAMQHGAVAFFEKPYDADALLATIRETLGDPPEPRVPETTVTGTEHGSIL